MLQCFLCKEKIRFHFYASKKLHDICMWNWVFRTRHPKVFHFVFNTVNLCLSAPDILLWYTLWVMLFSYSPFTCNFVHFCNTSWQFTVNFSIFFTQTFILAFFPSFSFIPFSLYVCYKIICWGWHWTQSVRHWK